MQVRGGAVAAGEAVACARWADGSRARAGRGSVRTGAEAAAGRSGDNERGGGPVGRSHRLLNCSQPLARPAPGATITTTASAQPPSPARRPGASATPTRHGGEVGLPSPRPRVAQHDGQRGALEDQQRHRQQRQPAIAELRGGRGGRRRAGAAAAAAAMLLRWWLLLRVPLVVGEVLVLSRGLLLLLLLIIIPLMLLPFRRAAGAAAAAAAISATAAAAIIGEAGALQAQRVQPLALVIRWGGAAVRVHRKSRSGSHGLNSIDLPQSITMVPQLMQIDARGDGSRRRCGLMAGHRVCWARGPTSTATVQGRVVARLSE